MTVNQKIIVSIELNHHMPARSLLADFDLASDILTFEAHSETGKRSWTVNRIESAYRLWNELMEAKRLHEAEGGKSEDNQG